MGKILKFKIVDGNVLVYKNEINFQDPNLFCIILEDLKSYGYPVDKVIKIYLSKEYNNFPLNI